MTEDWERVHLLEKMYLLEDEQSIMQETPIQIIDRDNILNYEDKVRTYGQSFSGTSEEGIFFRFDISLDADTERCSVTGIEGRDAVSNPSEERIDK
jgi:hypothetical protein